MMVVTGGGVRVRHILDIGIDLGMPTGVLAELAAKISEQNAEIVTLLLSKWHGSRVKPGDLLDLPTMLHLGLVARYPWDPALRAFRTSAGIGTHSSPPDRYRCRAHGGSVRCQELYPGEERGWPLTEDPRVNPDAELIKEITVDELIERDMEDMVMERKILFLLRDTVSVKEIKIVNGHKRGTLERVLNGENVGTTIRA